VEVKRKNGCVILVKLYYCNDNGKKKYSIVFQPDLMCRRLKVITKQFFDDNGVLQEEGQSVNLPKEIFSVLAQRAAAIMFEKRKKQ